MKTVFAQRLDEIQSIVNEQCLKTFGFKKFGRTHCKRTSDGLFQVINFQAGQRSMHGKFYVNIGIRVPESNVFAFVLPIEKKYYNETECNIRMRVQAFINRNRAEHFFCLEKMNTQDIAKEIICLIQKYVFPMFEEMDTRDKVLANRGKYSEIELLGHRINLETAMIYGYLGHIEKAIQFFQKHYDDTDNNHPHKKFLTELANKIGIELKT